MSTLLAFPSPIFIKVILLLNPTVFGLKAIEYSLELEILEAPVILLNEILLNVIYEVNVTGTGNTGGPIRVVIGPNVFDTLPDTLLAVNDIS